MITEMTIQNADVVEAIRLIEEYLYDGGVGFDEDKLERVLSALTTADRIIINSEK